MEEKSSGNYSSGAGMSIKQLFALFCLYLIYLNLGAVYFYHKESKAEEDRWMVKVEEKMEVVDLLKQNYLRQNAENYSHMMDKLSHYCGKDMDDVETELPQLNRQWDYFHSLFFVVTVCTTIGYGNLAPTVMSTRIFMIFYAVIGIGINGMLFASVADRFGRSFLRLYDRWKSHKKQQDESHMTVKLGVLGQIVLYLSLGFMFFIFMPAVVISYFEKWDYDVAVYYAFVSLSTIGFGDIVAGVTDNGFSPTWFWTYKVFLLVWIIAGLGYLVMVIGFVISGFRSKTIHQLEHKIAVNLKKSPQKVRRELRALLNEFLLLKVKRVYREDFVYTPLKRERSQSCPDLTIYRRSSLPPPFVPMRKRAKSEADNSDGADLMRIQSESDLGHIDKELTFKGAQAMVQPCQILSRFVNALGQCDTVEEEQQDHELEGFEGFTDSQILASEAYGSGWTIGSQKLSAIPNRFHRQRAASEVRLPTGNSQESVGEWTWSGPSATRQIQECRERLKYGKHRSRTLPPLSLPLTLEPTHQPNKLSLLSRIKLTFRKPPKAEDKSKLKQYMEEKEPEIKEKDDYLSKTSRGRGSNFSEDFYVPPQRKRRNSAYSMPEDPGDSLLERTSLADFIRALTAISIPEGGSDRPRRKMGLASLTPPSSAKATPPRPRRNPIRPPFVMRKASLTRTPTRTPTAVPRRYSLRGVPTISEGTMARMPPIPPPPYSIATQEDRIRPFNKFSNRFRLSPATITPTPSPIMRHVANLKREGYHSDSQDSLTDVRVDKT